MKFIKRSVIVFLFQLLFLSLFAQNSVLQKAATAYQEKNFEEALSLYEQLVSNYPENSDIIYNIGNCHFQLGQLGKAILSYRRCIKYNPSHLQAKENLKLALTFTKDKQTSESDDFISNLFNRILSILSLNILALMLLITFFIILLIINFILFRYRNREKTIPTFILLIFLFIFTFFSVLSVVQWQRYHSTKGAVLITSTAIGYSGPSDEFTRVFTIHEGISFDVEKKEGEWSLIKLPNGIGGWIKTTSFENI